MPTYAYFLGNHPLLSLAELESAALLDPANVDALTPEVLLAKAGKTRALRQPQQWLNDLGGTIKVADVLTTLNQTDTDEIADNIARLFQNMESKFSLGLSYIGDGEVSLKTLAHAIKDRQPKVRYLFPQSSSILSSGQILQHELLSNPNLDLTVVEQNGWTYLTRTIAVQDIVNYRLRDEGRPHRLRSQGMMPLKLCQILLNLALGDKPENSLVLDPFCGSGSILQEALCLGHQAIGADFNAQTLQKARLNLNWFVSHHAPRSTSFDLFQVDATKIGQALLPESADAIVSEGYLGQLFDRIPTQEQIETERKKLGKLYRAFLSQVRPLLKPEAKIVMTFPYYLQAEVSLFADLLDDLPRFHYHNKSLISASLAKQATTNSLPMLTERQTYIYSRPEQIVGREIVILTPS